MKINEPKRSSNEYNKDEKGMHSKNLVKGYLEYEKRGFVSMWAGAFFYNSEGKIKKHGVIIACTVLVLICVFRGLAAEFLWGTGDFWTAFIYPMTLFILVSLVALPAFILNWKYRGICIPEESLPEKKRPFMTILKVLLVIVLFLFYLVGVPLVTEIALTNIIVGGNTAFVFCSDMYVIYYIVGLCIMGIFVWLYARHGIFPQYSNGEWSEGVKARIPKKEKRKIAVFSIIIYLVASCLPLSWYNCFTEKGVEVRHFIFSEHYTWEDVNYYTLGVRFDKVLDFSIGLSNNTEISLDGAACTLEHLPEDTYPDGTEDFWYYLAHTFADRNIPLIVEDWAKLKDELGYDHWREVADRIRFIAGD